MLNLLNNRLIEAAIIVILLVGMVLRWMHIDDHAIVLNAGLLCFGVFSFVGSIRNGDHKRVSLDSMQLIFSLSTVLLAFGNLIDENQNYSLLVVNSILVIILTERKKFLIRKQS